MSSYWYFFFLYEKSNCNACDTIVNLFSYQHFQKSQPIDVEFHLNQITIIVQVRIYQNMFFSFIFFLLRQIVKRRSPLKYVVVVYFIFFFYKLVQISNVPIETVYPLFFYIIFVIAYCLYFRVFISGLAWPVSKLVGGSKEG